MKAKRRFAALLAMLTIASAVGLAISPNPASAALPDLTATYDSRVMDSKPTAFWKMQEASSSPGPIATTVADAVPPGSHNASLVPGLSTGQMGASPGPFGAGNLFYKNTTGASCMGVGGDYAAFNSDEFSVEAWVNPALSSGGGGPLFSNAGLPSGGGAAMGAFVTVTPSGISSSITTASGSVSASGATSILSSGWHHVAMTRRAGVQSLWVDGAFVGASATQLGSIKFGDTSRLIFIGASHGCTTSYTGGITEMSYYNRAIDESEIKDHYCFASDWAHLVGSGCGIPSNVSNPDTSETAEDPVDVATGNYTLSSTDITGPDSAPNVGLSRTYNSGMYSQGMFGPRGRSNLETSVTLTGSNDVTLTESNGLVRTFAGPSSSSWSAPATYQGSSITKSSGVYTLRRPDGSVDTFSSAGKLTSRTDPAGNQAAISWAPSTGVVAIVSGPGGYTMTLSDDKVFDPPGSGQDGLVDKVTTSDGRMVTYGYRFDGMITMLATVSKPHTAAQDTATPRSFGLTRYDTKRTLMTGVYEELDVGREHRLVANTYDGQQRVATQVTSDGDPVTFQYGVPNPQSTTVTNMTSGDQTQYHFDSTGRLDGQTDARIKASVQSWTSPTSALIASRTSRSNIVTATAYDSDFRPTAFSKAIGLGTPVPTGIITYWTPAGSAGASQDLRIASSTDAAGVKTEYAYTGTSTFPDSVTTPCDPDSSPTICPRVGTHKVTTSYLYGSGGLAGLVTRETDPDGVKTENTYNGDRSLHESKIFPNGSTPQTTAYTYATSGALSCVSGKDYLVAKVVTVTAPDSTSNSTWYDADGKVLEERDALFNGSTHKATCYSYYFTGDLKSVTNPAGAVTNYSVLLQGDTGWPSGFPSTATRADIQTNPDGISSVTFADASGDPIQDWHGKLSTPATVAKTVRTYGQLGRQLTETNPAGVKTTYTYDDEGRQTSATTGPSGTDTAHMNSTTYDAFGNATEATGTADLDPDSASVQSKTTSTYDDAGRILTKIEGSAGAAGDKLMTSYVYDNAGRLFQTIEHRDGSVDTAHPATIHNGDKVTETRYTVAGRPWKTLEPGVDQPAFAWVQSVDTGKLMTTYGYDAAGRPTSSTDPAGKATTTAYDPAGRVATVTSPAGRVTSYTYDAAGQTIGITTPSGLPSPQPATVTETKSYWADGTLKTDTDPHVVVSGVTDPSTRNFTYSPGGRLLDAQDPDGRHVTYTYDDRGNRSSLVAQDDSAASQTESWTWDLADRMATHTVPPPRGGAASMTTTYTYDPYGNLGSITDPTGRLETRSYYGSGALKARTWIKSGLPTVSSTNWINRRGWVTKMRDTTGSTNRDTTYTLDRAGQRLGVTSPSGTLGYQWDVVGNMTQLTYTDGAFATYTHTPTGQIATFSVASDSTSAALPFASYTYDDDGIQTNEYMYSAGGNTRANTLNAAGKTTVFTEVMKKPDSTWETYTSNLGFKADQRLGTEQVNAGSTATMSYDNAGQLTGQTGPNPVGYTYGTRGNRLTQVAGSATTNYATNPNGSVASATTGSTVIDYAYDDAGRRTSATTKVSGTTTRTVTTAYDARGKGSSITTAAGSTTGVEARTYDGDGSLTKFTITGGSTNDTYDQMWDTTREVPEAFDVKVNGSLLIRADYANERISYKSGWFPSWYKLDAHNSVINPDSNANAAVGPTKYDPFGTPTGATYFATAYRSEFQLGDILYLRNRDYDPSVGQFTSADPFAGVDGSATVGNSYHYANNDPYNVTDPLGLRPNECTHVDVWALAGVIQKMMYAEQPPPCGFAAKHGRPYQVDIYGRAAMQAKKGDGCSGGLSYAGKTLLNKPCLAHDFGYDVLRYVFYESGGNYVGFTPVVALRLARWNVDAGFDSLGRHVCSKMPLFPWDTHGQELTQGRCRIEETIMFQFLIAWTAWEGPPKP